MSIELLLKIYIVLFVVIYILEIYMLLNNKEKFLRKSYKPLKIICQKVNDISENQEKILTEDILRFYNEYIQEEPRIKKFFPNVVRWLDAIIFKVNCGEKNATILTDFIDDLKKSRDLLEENNPYNKCEKYQQGILNDISRLQTKENEIVVQNIINRTEEEFLRLTGEVEKNNKLNMISILIGIFGIIVSVLMTFVKL